MDSAIVISESIHCCHIYYAFFICLMYFLISCCMVTACFPLSCRCCLQQQSLSLSIWGTSLSKTLQLTWQASTTTCPPPHHSSSSSAQDLTLWGPFSALQKREVVLTGKRQTDDLMSCLSSTTEKRCFGFFWRRLKKWYVKFL